MAVDVDAILGFGTLLQCDRGSGFETVAGLFEIGEFGPESDDVERTTHGSPGGWRRFSRGLIDPGSMPISGYWTADPSQVAIVDESQADFLYEAEIPYRILLPNGMGQFDCGGFIQNFKVNPQMDGNLEFSGDLRWSGQASFTVVRSAGLTTPFLVVTPALGTIPAPAQNTLNYYVNEATGTSSVTVTPTAAVGVITVNGVVTTTGTPSAAIPLGPAGSATRVAVSVKEPSKSPKEYSLHILRA